MPGQPWSDLETSHLIASYGEKWHALNRGPLRTHHWDAVAASLASRFPSGATRTGTQCRHKMEKLRKRYRAERKRPVASLWVHFQQMDRLERGPLPVSSRPPEAEESEEEEEEEEERETPAPRVLGAEDGRKLAAVVRRVGEGLLRIEKRKMELMRDLERDWMEVEERKAEMLLDFERYAVGRITRAFDSAKKAKRPPPLPPPLQPPN